MKIDKFIDTIVVPTEDVSIMKNFIAKRGDEIQKAIMSLWEDFSKSEGVNVSEEFPIKLEEKTEVVSKESQIVNATISDLDGDEPEGLKDEPGILAESMDIPVILPNAEPIITNVPFSEPPIVKKNPEVVANDPFDLLIKNKHITLPNGKVNQEYNFVFNAEQTGIPEIGDVWFEDLDAIGLHHDIDNKTITGTPLCSGDFNIKLFLKRKDWVTGKPYFSRTITLIINPDPKSLWKNIITPTNIEYYKPDSEKKFVKVTAKRSVISFKKDQRKDMVAASQRGRSHAHDGMARDDDFGLRYLEKTEWYIMTVADGAGGSRFSRKGSAIACKTVLEVCKLELENKHKDFENLIKAFSKDKSDEKRKKMGDVLYGIVGKAVFDALKNIKEVALKANNPLKDYSTTLIVSICKKFSFGWFVGAFWVGDGGIGIYNKDTQFLKVMGESDGGEFAGQTRFLTMPEITVPVEIYRRLRFDIVDDFTSLILMTDGITDAKFETDANLMRVEKWNELWEDLLKVVDFSDDNEASADQLLKWLDFWSPGNHDDRTIAILFCLWQKQ